MRHFDAIILGSGAGGGAAAHVLTANGLNVLVLEAGANRFVGLDDPTRQPISLHTNDELKNGRNFILPDVLVDPRTFRETADDGPRTFVGDVNALPKTVGGGAVHADLKMPRFEPQDFRLGSLILPVPGASFADWPVDYDMLEPFYTLMERVMGVQGRLFANPFEGPRSTDFPMPPGVPMYCSEHMREALEARGMTLFPFPTAVNSRPFDGRPACVDCGFCSGFGCPTNAKGSPAVTTLRRALLTGRCLLLPETKAVRLRMSSTGATVAAVEAIDPSGARVEFTGDRVILAMSPIEDARLCFLSGDGAPIGNSSDQVGRNLMFHLQTNAIGIFEERLHGHRGRTVTHGFSDLRGRAGDPDRPLGGVVEVSGSEGPLSEAKYYALVLKTLGALGGPGFRGDRFKRLMKESPLRDRIVALALQGEDAPQPTNRVDLDPDVVDLDGIPVARVTYQSHPWELATSDFYKPVLLDLLLSSGARWAVPAPRDTISASAHIMGTLRMGTVKSESVCDPTGRFHDVGNLFCADGALFPTSSGYNPTMTIVALAAWVAASIAQPGAPERAIAPALP